MKFMFLIALLTLIIDDAKAKPNDCDQFLPIAYQIAVDYSGINASVTNQDLEFKRSSFGRIIPNSDDFVLNGIDLNLESIEGNSNKHSIEFFNTILHVESENEFNINSFYSQVVRSMGVKPTDCGDLNGVLRSAFKAVGYLPVGPLDENSRSYFLAGKKAVAVLLPKLKSSKQKYFEMYIFTELLNSDPNSLEVLFFEANNSETMERILIGINEYLKSEVKI